MLTIEDMKFKLKNKDLKLIIDDNNKIIHIDILTYLGVFNERMDDIKIDIEFDTKIRKLSDLKDNQISFYATSPTWEDNGEGVLVINNINANKLDVIINLQGKYNYHIETILEATWLSLKEEIEFDNLEKYIDLDEIETIPFINEDENHKEINYMFKKEKVTLL